MSKAEDRADEITRAALDYCNNIEDVEPTDDFRRRLCIVMGQSFIKGAEWADKHQAEKDLALTVNDIMRIDALLIKECYNYDVVLRKFIEMKNK